MGFKIGDIVKVVQLDDDKYPGLKETIGKIGSIMSISEGLEYPINIRFNNGMNTQVYKSSELELVDEVKPLLKEDDKIKEGDNVKIINKNRTYTSYEAFVNEYAYNLIDMFYSGYVPKNGAVGKVIANQKHMTWEDNVCIVKLFFEDKVIVIGEDGLEKLI